MPTGCRRNCSVERPTATLRATSSARNVYNGTGDDAENIGDVNDIVIGADGKRRIRRRSASAASSASARRMSPWTIRELDWAERDGDRWLVVPMTKEQLESQPAFDASAYEPAPANSRRTHGDDGRHGSGTTDSDGSGCRPTADSG